MIFLFVKFVESLPDESVKALFDLYLTSQGCVLLLILKQHLKDMYGFTDRLYNIASLLLQMISFTVYII